MAERFTEEPGAVACRIERLDFQTDSDGRPPHSVLERWLVEHRKMNRDWQLKSVQEVDYSRQPLDIANPTATRHEYATYLIIWE
jgi:hypothetical protein